MAAWVYFYVLVPPRITIIAQDVVTDDRGYPEGWFYIGPTTDDRKTIRSEGAGGGCLVADLNFLDIPGRAVTPGVGQCDIDAECRDGLPAGRGWIGYCIENTCWTRPGGQKAFCMLSKDDNGGKPWPTGNAYYAASVKVSVRKVGDAVEDSIDDLYSQIDPGTEIRWRMTTCLSSYKAVAGTNCPQDPGHMADNNGPINSLPVPDENERFWSGRVCSQSKKRWGQGLGVRPAIRDFLTKPDKFWRNQAASVVVGPQPQGRARQLKTSKFGGQTCNSAFKYTPFRAVLRLSRPFAHGDEAVPTFLPLSCCGHNPVQWPLIEEAFLCLAIAGGRGSIRPYRMRT